jgi:hypothetical protein
VRPEPITATTPQVCLYDPKPDGTSVDSDPSESGQVTLTGDPTHCIQPPPPENYCGSPGSQLYYQNENNNNNQQPAVGKICVNKRDNGIPDYVIAANMEAHAAIRAYLLQQNNTRSDRAISAPWLSYKLVNVQYYPYDKIPNPGVANGSPYTAQPPYTASNPAPSSYYQANIVVETNRSLQLFAGGLTQGGQGISTEWNMNGTPHKNMYYGARTDEKGKPYNMGGCMGCHGSQGQQKAGDFSVILAKGAVLSPEVPSQSTPNGLTKIQRNR